MADRREVDGDIRSDLKNIFDQYRKLRESYVMLQEAEKKKGQLLEVHRLEIARIQDTVAKMCAGVRERDQRKNNEFEELRRNNGELCEEIDALQRECDTLRSAEEETTALLATYREKISNLESELAKEKATRENREKEIQELKKIEKEKERKSTRCERKVQEQKEISMAAAHPSYNSGDAAKMNTANSNKWAKLNVHVTNNDATGTHDVIKPRSKKKKLFYQDKNEITDLM